LIFGNKNRELKKQDWFYKPSENACPSGLCMETCKQYDEQCTVWTAHTHYSATDYMALHAGLYTYLENTSAVTVAGILQAGHTTNK